MEAERSGDRLAIIDRGQVIGLGYMVPGYWDGLALAVLGAWCLAGLAINYRVATRRG